MSSDSPASGNRIKVLFVLNTDIRLGGGVEKVILNYIRYAPRDQFDITVLQTDYMDQQRLADSYVEESLKGINVVRIKGYDHMFDSLSRSRPGLILANTILIPALLNILSATVYRKTVRQLKDTDIIYLFKNDYYRLFKRLKAIIIGSNHTGLASERTLSNRMEFKLIRKGIVDRRIDGFHFFPSKSRILPTLGKRHNLILTNGVDTVSYHPSVDRKDGKIRLLYVGRLESYKGILTVLKAWDTIKDSRNLELHVVGGGTLWKEVADRSDGSLIYHGILSDDELAETYRSCDIFVYPTQWDTFSLVVLEALTSGIHALVSDNLEGSFDNFREKGYLEYLPNDPGVISRRILELVPAIEKFRNDSEDLYTYIKDNYDWKPVTEKLFEFLKQSVESERR